MPEIDPVAVRLYAEFGKYRADMEQTARRVTANLDQQERAVISLERQMDRGFTRIGASSKKAELMVGGSLNAIKGALAGVSVIALAQSFVAIADEAKKLDAQLKLATQGFGSFGQAQDDVRRIADATRSGLVETASLYGNFARGAKELGASQAEAARATETFSKSLKISGADAGQAASATLQFGQALASGTLRGDELNSILEASPRLARLLAESMGQPIGKIRELGEQGLLTSDKLLRALTDRKFTAGIDAEFRQIPITFDDAMTRVHNSAVITFGAFDRGGEFSTMLANFVAGGADGFASLEDRAEQFGIEVRATLEGLSDVFDPLLTAGESVFDALGLKAFDFSNFVRSTLKEFDAITGYLANTPGGRFLGATGGTDTLGTYDKARNADRDRRIGEAAERKFRKLVDGYDLFGNRIDGAPGGARPPATRAGSTTGAKRSASKAPKSKLDPEAFAREEASLNDEILRLKGGEVVSLSEKAAIDIARIEAARNAAIEQIKADERLTGPQKEKLTALSDQVAAMKGAAVVAERDRLLAQQVAEARQINLQYARDVLEAEAQGADTREAKLSAERRLLKFMEQREREELEALIVSGKIADAERARLDLATAQTARRSSMERDNEGPLAAYARNLGATSLGDQAEQIVVDQLQTVQNGITDALAGALGTKNSLIKSLIALFVQQVIMRPIAEALAQSGGGGGGLGGIFGSIFGAVIGGGKSYATNGIGGAIMDGKGPVHDAFVNFFKGGRASGGYVAPGQAVRVNEHRGTGVELLRMGSQGGTVIPLGQVNAAPRGGNTIVQQTFVLDNRYGITTPQLIDYVNSTAKAEAARAGMASYQQSMRDAPAAIRKQSRYGTS